MIRIPVFSPSIAGDSGFRANAQFKLHHHLAIYEIATETPCLLRFYSFRFLDFDGVAGCAYGIKTVIDIAEGLLIPWAKFL